MINDLVPAYCGQQSAPVGVRRFVVPYHLPSYPHLRPKGLDSRLVLSLLADNLNPIRGRQRRHGR